MVGEREIPASQCTRILPPPRRTWSAEKAMAGIRGCWAWRGHCDTHSLPDVESKRQGGQNPACDGAELKMTLGFRICGSWFGSFLHFFRKVHPCLLPCAYFSSGTTDIAEHCDTGNASKTAGALFARKTGFFFKILAPCLASWQQRAVPGGEPLVGTLMWRGWAQSLEPHHKAHRHW